MYAYGADVPCRNVARDKDQTMHVLALDSPYHDAVQSVWLLQQR